MKRKHNSRVVDKAMKKSYRTRFLKEATIPARIGKTVYIRKEYHERIQLILRVIGKDEVSLFSYIDNVLAHHFDAPSFSLWKRYWYACSRATAYGWRRICSGRGGSQDVPRRRRMSRLRNTETTSRILSAEAASA